MTHLLQLISSKLITRLVHVTCIYTQEKSTKKYNKINTLKATTETLHYTTPTEILPYKNNTLKATTQLKENKNKPLKRKPQQEQATLISQHFNLNENRTLVFNKNKNKPH